MAGPSVRRSSHGDTSPHRSGTLAFDSWQARNPRYSRAAIRVSAVLVTLLLVALFLLVV
jgi:hypothetical protein